jgi:endonuclease/exonuclease/phosphatase family metal-dependent hydrolase
LYLAGDEEKAALTLLSMNIQSGKGSQWSWERDSAEKAWHDSMGWDIVFLCNLLIKD